MDQATITLQQRIGWLDRKEPRKAKPKAKKPKFVWYRPPTLASISKPYGKHISWVVGGTTPIKGSACYKSRVSLCPSNWPADIGLLRLRGGVAMSHFYGVVTGQAKTQATRRGSKLTGLRVAAAGLFSAASGTTIRRASTILRSS
jgi:hypothetical protein